MSEMRVLESEIGNVVPLVDIADAIGYSRSALSKIYKSNEDLLKATQIFRPLQTNQGVQQFTCINRTGLDLLMILIKPAKSRDSFEKFLKFREIALNRLGNNDSLEPNGNGDIKSEITKAKMLAQATGGNLAEFQAIALAKCGYSDYIPALKTAAITHGESGWFNPTQLVPLCNDPYLNAERLNYYLANNPKDPERRPFQYRDENRIWRLTPLGMEHGREYIFRGIGGHTEPRIEWRESILYASGLLKHTGDSLAVAVRA
jgi:hypothetical protein